MRFVGKETKRIKKVLSEMKHLDSLIGLVSFDEVKRISGIFGLQLFKPSIDLSTNSWQALDLNWDEVALMLFALALANAGAGQCPGKLLGVASK